MTHVQFFHGARDRLQAAVEWLAENAGRGRRILVWSPSQDVLSRVDRLLWTAQATGFTAHCSSESPLSAETPVVLSTTTDLAGHDEFLLNLSDEIPPGFGRFGQLVEIVSIDDSDRSQGRERYKFYRDRGYPMEATSFSGAPQR